MKHITLALLALLFSFAAYAQAPIAGPTAACIGITDTLTDATPGGTWSSSNPAIAAIGSSTGFVTGITAGTVTITYTVGTYVTATFTVNPLPNTYTLTAGSYCAGGTGVHIILSGSQSGFNYQLLLSGAPIGLPITGTGSLLDFGLQTTAGIYTVVGTNPATTCYSLSGPATITINPLPTPYTVSGGGSFCPGGIGELVNLNNSNPGINYQLYNGLVPVGAPLAGTGALISYGYQTTPGTYTVIAADATTGCTNTMTGSAIVSLLAAPATITGSSTICLGSTSTYTDATPGGTWTSSTITIATINPGTGVATGISLGTTTINYTIGTGCTASKSVTVSPLPTAYLVTGGGSYCAGGTGVPVGLNLTVTGINYQLYVGASPVGSPLAGTGTAINFGLQTTAGTYTVVATNVTTGCTNNMTGSVTITINPLPVISGPLALCPSSTITLTGSPAGGTWTSSNPAVAIISSGVVTGITAGTTNITYILPTGCFSSVTVTVTPGPTAITGPSTVCVGTTTIYTDGYPGGTWSSSNTAIATIGSTSGIVTGISPGIIYILYSLGTGCSINKYITVNPSPASITGIPTVCVGGTTTLSDATPDGTLSSSNPAVAVVSGLGVVTGLSAGTATISYTVGGCAATIIVTVNPLPALHNIIGGGHYCAGGVGINISLDASDSGISYQLYNGSTAVGSPITGIGGPIDFGNYTAAGTYTVVATNGAGCTRTMSGTAVITIDPLPAAYTVTGGGGYCPGGTGVHVYLSGSNTGVSYQLMRGVVVVGSPLPGTGSSLDFGLQTVAGTYTVVATNTTTGCVNTMTGSVAVVIEPLPVVYTVTGGGPYCSGGTGVHIGLNGSNTGINYQLYRGVVVVGSPVPGTGLPLDFGLQTAVGSYTVVAVNATTGCTSNMMSSATISINPLPPVDTVTGGGTFCYGGTGIDVSLINTSYIGIDYQLYNGLTAVGGPLAGTGSVLDFGLQTSAGTYTVVATNTSTSCTNNMFSSATITVTTAYLPIVTIAASPGDTVCPGTMITFTATPVYGGTSPTFQWFVNGVSVGTAITYSYMPANGDVVFCRMTSDYPCRLADSVTSSDIIMAVNIMPAVTGPTSVCIGSTINLSDVTLGGTWTSSDPGIAIIATIGGSTGVVTGIATGTVIMTYMLGTGCYATEVVTVNAVPSVLANPSTGCGEITTLTASGAVSYSWSPATGLTCSTCAVTDADPTTTTTYTVTGTNTAGCSQTATVLVNGNRIDGHISYSGTPGDSLKVWLIQFNPSDSSIYALDSTFTCMDGGAPYYQFNGAAGGNYMVKAKLVGSIPGTSGYIPTYSLSTPHWDSAATIAHTAGTDSLHIDMVYGTVPPGPGFIGGLISSGAGKGTSGDVPAVGMLVLLKDAGTGNVLTFTYTDGTGAYSFSNLANGSYIIYPEDYAYYTVPSPAITLSITADSANAINFKEHTTSKSVTPILPSNVATVTAGIGWLQVYPNPTTGTLNILWDEQAIGIADVALTDVTGRLVYKTAIDVDAIKTINKTTPISRIDLSDLKDAIYFITIKAGPVYYSGKVMILQ